MLAKDTNEMFHSSGFLFCFSFLIFQDFEMQPSLYCSLNKLPPPQVCEIKVMFELNAEENDMGTGFNQSQNMLGSWCWTKNNDGG